MDSLLLANNTRIVNSLQRNFIQYTHEGTTDRYLVTRSQDKSYLDRERINSIVTNNVSVQLNITVLLYQLLPVQENLLGTMLKQVKESVEEYLLNSNSIAFTKIPENTSDIKTYCLNNIYSIVQNILKLTSIINSSIVNIKQMNPLGSLF